MLTKLAGYGMVIVPPIAAAQPEFKTHPIGTGPFKVVDYQPKVSLTLELFAGHWGGPAKLEKLVYRFIVEPDTQVAELQAGRVDIATNIPVSLVPAITQTPKPAGGKHHRTDRCGAALQHRQRHHQGPEGAAGHDHGCGPGSHRQDHPARAMPRR